MRTNNEGFKRRLMETIKERRGIMLEAVERRFKRGNVTYNEYEQSKALIENEVEEELKCIKDSYYKPVKLANVIAYMVTNEIKANIYEDNLTPEIEKIIELENDGYFNASIKHVDGSYSTLTDTYYNYVETIAIYHYITKHIEAFKLSTRTKRIEKLLEAYTKLYGSIMNDLYYNNEFLLIEDLKRRASIMLSDSYEEWLRDEYSGEI